MSNIHEQLGISSVLNKVLIGVETQNLRPDGGCDWLVLTFDGGVELTVNPPQSFYGIEIPFQIEVKHEGD